MKTTWQLHEAKNRLSELVGCAQTQGPQTVTARRSGPAQKVMTRLRAR